MPVNSTVCCSESGYMTLSMQFLFSCVLQTLRQKRRIAWKRNNVLFAKIEKSARIQSLNHCKCLPNWFLWPETGWHCNSISLSSFCKSETLRSRVGVCVELANENVKCMLDVISMHEWTGFDKDHMKWIYCCRKSTTWSWVTGVPKMCLMKSRYIQKGRYSIGEPDHPWLKRQPDALGQSQVLAKVNCAEDDMSHFNLPLKSGQWAPVTEECLPSSQQHTIIRLSLKMLGMNPGNINNYWPPISNLTHTS